MSPPGRPEDSAIHPPGTRLVYLMGASGSGKDTLLRCLRTALQPQEPVLVAHRYITRPSGADEASVSLSEAEFERRAAMGCFALHWASHGLRYGIGIEIDTWLASGAAVVINGSRAHLAQACARYPDLAAIEVVADPAILARRLAARGRETPEQIAARLQRASRPFLAPAGCQVTQLANNGLPEEAAQRLLSLVRSKLSRCNAL
ncbi:phosphonate metabolism protein/1,5-bisphosphokinase (PRPP-forming) PhnN [Bordetella petrii]|uniref:phosphonate metabolism protein/1,5-bisphosphokinase (PRPP-forming) PhnN n=1 Tax=Bordetella petrii TaxID=94624 RepID=UPI001A976CE4|nr:phosphonate metabolism protein/1,5-bisphosphokinase (PRPP-forming) PhnN [Bordetella petrii]MBO1113385.1 phosphonate metabolism protein/1,5-bisphosphokinase (PRPP-forming) PhnN [Bordetella petrii]